MKELKRKPVNILIAEDDPDDRLMTQDAFRENHLKNDLFFVEDGEQLMNYLNGIGKYSDRSKYPMPGLILLDLNMPKKDGREALKEIKLNNELKRIPIVILTTSKAEEDVIKSYDLGVNCFITKPVTFQGLVDVTNVLGRYWFEIVELPTH